MDDGKDSAGDSQGAQKIIRLDGIQPIYRCHSDVNLTLPSTPRMLPLQNLVGKSYSCWMSIQGTSPFQLQKHPHHWWDGQQLIGDETKRARFLKALAVCPAGQT